MAAVYETDRWAMYKNFGWRDKKAGKMVSPMKVPAAVRKAAGWSKEKQAAYLARIRKKANRAKKSEAPKAPAPAKKTTKRATKKACPTPKSSTPSPRQKRRAKLMWMLLR